MAEHIEREAEDYWCERCCNFDKENVGMDGTATCKLTGCLAYCQEYGGNCKGFKVPAADVVEVRHGEWDDNIIGFCNVCMECGAIVERTAIKNKSGELNYCPNCGAKMDGKGEGE